MSNKTPYIAVAVLLYAAMFFLYYPTATDHPYAYDEADYMWAGTQGLAANYTERNALPASEFVSKGLELARDPAKRSSFSQYIRSTGDIGLYRHYHGPMYAYWIAALHDLGVSREATFRRCSLIIHLATATLILFGFWAAFPTLPPLAGLAACALFVFNRTALVAGLAISQHVVFTFFATATLFAASFFFRTWRPRWWYLTMAALAAAFCTVETSALLVMALVIGLIVYYRRVREQWPSLRSFAGLIAKGVGVFSLTMAILWPGSVLYLGIAKGFLTLAYISVHRKTFSPIGVLDLWRGRFEASPWEFSLLIAGLIAALLLWWRSAHRAELTPWLAFILLFFAITIKVTVPYTYYYAPLTAALTVATGAGFGMLWTRAPRAGQWLLALLVAGSIAGTTAEYRDDAMKFKETTPYHVAALKVMREHPASPGQAVYLPYQLVPTLHFYQPQVTTVGYDAGYPMDQVVEQAASPAASKLFLCEQPFCAAMEARFPARIERKIMLDASGPNDQPFFALLMRKPEGN